MNIVLSRFACCGGLFLAIATPAWGAEPAARGKTKSTAKMVELFDGMNSGEVEAKLIPKDATEGLLMIKNQTNQPLTIKLPEVFAAVPVLAQGRQRGGGGGGMGGGMGQSQGMGGGMGGGGGCPGMGGGGMFNVAPEKVTKIKIAAVCLDHGKKDPSPKVAYQLVPIESYAKSPQVSELIKLLLRGEIDQHSAQAATWHLQNGLSWEALVQKIGAKHLDGSTEPYFTPDQLDRALAATEIARERAERLPEQASPSATTSALTPSRPPATESAPQP